MKSMNNEKLVLGGAVLFAAVLVAQKSGLLAKLFAGQAPGRVSFAGFQPEDSMFIGYNENSPGDYVSVDDLIKDAAGGSGEWMTIPTFGQSGDNALGGFSLINKPTWAP